MAKQYVFGYKSIVDLRKALKDMLALARDLDFTPEENPIIYQAKLAMEQTTPKMGTSHAVLCQPYTRRTQRKIMPFQSSDCGNYWDYSFFIKGLVYQASVDKRTGKLYINKDTDQPDEGYVIKPKSKKKDYICEVCNTKCTDDIKERCGGGCYDYFCSEACHQTHVNKEE